MNRLTIGILSLLTGILLASAVQCNWDKSGRPETNPTAETILVSNASHHGTAPGIAPVTVVSNSEELTIKLFEEAAPSVVYITTTTLQQDYFTRNVYEMPSGTGSGFIWDNKGHIVTNYHVIKGSNRAKVTLSDQTTYDAEVVGREPQKDIAVLRINAKGPLRPLPLGTSHDLKVGQSVFAIGNPFGLDQSLTTGVISALGREIQSVSNIPIRDVIQTDAAINPGNSGGPLLDISGRLIGVNTAIYSPSGAYAGIGFSVPVDIVNWVVPDLITYGKVNRPILGVDLVNQQTIDRLDLEGALVMNVAPGSGAQRGGMRSTRRLSNGDVSLGDLIVAINNEPIRSNNDLLLTLEKYKPGDRIEITIKRDDQSSKLTVVLGSSL